MRTAQLLACASAATTVTHVRWTARTKRCVWRHPTTTLTHIYLPAFWSNAAGTTTTGCTAATDNSVEMCKVRETGECIRYCGRELSSGKYTGFAEDDGTGTETDRCVCLEGW